MFVPFHDGVISQFEGYEDLEELDWDAYRARYGNIQRLDRILRAEGDAPDRYRLTKQADAVMLLFLFPDDELTEVLDPTRATGPVPTWCGAPSSTTTAAPRTARRSASSPTPGCSPRSTSRAPGGGSWSRWRATSATSRAGPPRRGSTSGSWPGRSTWWPDATPGARIEDGAVHLAPRLPRGLEAVAFPLQCHGTPVEVEVRHDRVTLSVVGEAESGSVRVCVGDEVRTVRRGESETFSVGTTP